MRFVPRPAVRSGATALFLILACCGTASAACQNTYTGPAGGEWNDNSHWTLAADSSVHQFPTSAQDVCIPAGASVQIIEHGNAYAAGVSVGAGAKITLRTDPGFSSTLAYFGDVDNAGTIEFTATGGPTDNDQSTLTIAAGHTLTNRGVLHAAQSEGFSVIAGDVDTTATGSIVVDSWLRILGNGGFTTWRNAGAVTVATGQSLTAESGWGLDFRQTGGTFTNNGELTFNNPADVLTVSGGAFTGTPPLMHQGSLALTGGTGTARIQYGNASLATDVAAGWTIRIEDRGSDTTRLKVPAGATRTNAGTIVFAKDPAAGTIARVHTSLDIGGGASLTNTGTIRADADVVNGEAITAQYVTNQNYADPTAFKQNGTLAVHHSLTTPPFTQRGTTTVDGGTRLTVGNPFEATDPGLLLAAGTLDGNGNVAARKVVNSGGIVAPTPGPTSLTLSYNNIYETEVAGGDYIQQTGGKLRTRLAPLGSGLTVGGNVQLAGTWDVAAASGYTPPAGQTYPIIRISLPSAHRSGTFTTVTGAFTPTYELDGADVTVPYASGHSTLSVADTAVKEGDSFIFTVKRSAPATGTANVHWSLRDIGSAVGGADYPTANGAIPMAGDLAFADGETEKTVTTIWTLNEGNPEPDESFQFHLSHPDNVPIARATATATIVNDDTSLTSVAPNVLGDDGPTTVTLRGTGLTSKMTLLLRHGGRPDIAPSSVVASDDGLTATAVFDTAGAQPQDGSWYVEARNQGSNGGYQMVTIQHATSAARPFVQVAGTPYARGGVPSFDDLHYGNLGGSASRPAFLRLSGYPTGADVSVDHVPPGASTTIIDGISGRTVVVAVGRIPAKANEYLQVRYVPTTTIGGHTKLKIKASLTFSDATTLAAPTDVRTLTGVTTQTPTGGDQLSADLAFSPSGSAHLSYGQAAPDDDAPIVTHTGNLWTFTGTSKTVDAAPRFGTVDVPYTKGQVKVDFNGGTFKVTGPLQDINGAYKLSVDRKRLTECMKAYNLIDADDYADLMRFADGAVVMQGMATVVSANNTISTFVPQMEALNAVMGGAWEMRVAKGHTALLDQVANPKLGFFPEQDDEYQMLWLMQLCADRPDPADAPEPVYINGEYQPSEYIKELLQSFDPNEKSGTQGGGAVHAVRSDVPIDYRVGFQNLPAASAAAQTVTVTDQLDPAKVDLSTFSLGPIAFGDQFLTPPGGVTSWTTTVDLRPKTDLLVKVAAALDVGTGKVTWTFSSLDPATGQPTTDALAGFLPPDTAPPAGEGSVSYAVSPKPGIASGATIAGDASIVFDTNAPIVTNVWSNLIDDDAPSGAVVSASPPAGSTECGALDVTWSGTDAASGIGSYDVWVSEDGGEWSPWRVRTTDTSGTYPGTAGHSYRFDVQARDLADNLQSADRGDARTALDCTALPPTGGGGSPQGGGTQPPAGGGGGGAPQGGGKLGGKGTPAKPWLKIGNLPTKLTKGALPIRLTCPATEPRTTGCRGRLTLTTLVRKGKRKVSLTLGTVSFKVRAGKSATVSLKLTRKAQKLLRSGSLRVSVVAKPSARGDKRKASAAGTLKRVRR